jgi:autotransporter translocation and assembly factor TamB
MKRTLRYMFRGLIILLMLIVVLAAGLTIYIRTASFNRLLEHQVNSALSGRFRGQLAIGTIQASRIGRVDLRDLTIVYQGRALLHVPLLKIGYALFPLLWHQVDLAITIEDPSVHIVRTPDGQWDLAEAMQATHPSPSSSGPTAYTVMLNALTLSNGTIELAPQGLAGPHYRISAAQLDARVKLLRSGLKLDVRQLSAHLEAPKVPVADLTMAASYDASSSPAILQLTSLRLTTQASSIAAIATIRNPPSPAIDAQVTIIRLATSDLTWIHGYPLRDDIAGSITVKGPASALHTALTLSAGPARATLAANIDISGKQPAYDGSLTVAHVDLGRLVLGLKLAGVLDTSAQVQGKGTQPAAIAVTVNANGRGLVVNNLRAGNVALTATSKNGNAQLAGTLASGPSRISYGGSVANFAAPRVQAHVVTLHLDLRSLMGRGQPQSDINATLGLDGAGFNPGNLNLAQIDAHSVLKLARTSIQNQVIDNGAVDARLHSGSVNLTQMAVNAQGAALTARGTIGVVPHSITRLSYTMRAQRLAPLLQIAQLKGGGRLDLDGTAIGKLVGSDATGLHAQGRAVTSNLNLNGTTLTNGIVTYDLSRIGKGGLPLGRARIQLAAVAFGSTHLRLLTADAQITRQQPITAALALKVVDAQGHPHSAAANFITRNGDVTGTLTEISVAAPDGTWGLVAPTHFTVGSRAISIANFQVRNGSRELALNGTMRITGPQNVTFTARDLDLALIKPLLQPDQQPNGTIAADIVVTGTAAAPILQVHLNGQRLAMHSQRIGDLTLQATYTAGATGVNLVLYQDHAHQMTLIGRLPMSLDWQRGFHAHIGNDAALKLYSAGLRLGGLAALAPRLIRDAAGQLAFNLAINGTPLHPAVTGTMAVDNVGGRIIPLGVNIDNAFVHMRMTPGQFTLEQLLVTSGSGSIKGSGSVALANYTPGAVNFGITLNQWPAIHNEQYQATIGGALQVRGTPSAPEVTGRLDLLNATIHPDLAFLTATKYSRDSTIEINRPGANPPPAATSSSDQANRLSPVNPASKAAPPSSLFDNLAINAAVVIHRNSWIRHPEAAVELAGHLRIVKVKLGPLTLVGEIDTVRGWIVFNSQTFTLASGQILFTGGSTIDPSLNLDAQYTASDYTIDVLVTGFASKPVLKLQSSPPLPQADILSLLIFGKPASSLGQGQSSSLQQQAVSMAAGAAASTIGQALSSSLGLESLGIDINGAAGNGSVGFGRYIGKNTYISAAQSTIGGQGRKVSIQYYIKRWLSITTSTNSNGSSEIFLNLTHPY